MKYCRIDRYIDNAQTQTKIRIIAGIACGEIRHKRNEQTYCLLVCTEDVTKYLKTNRLPVVKNAGKSKQISLTKTQKNSLRSISNESLCVFINSEGYALCSISSLLSFLTSIDVKEEVPCKGLVLLSRKGVKNVRRNQN